ncbi:MAG: prepilin peptidase [Planctomycetota bacterium]|nr:prepilin peptidase [Planctomycetota bacterium]
MNPIWIWLGFAFLFGASIGSFLNVLVYRLPEGMSISLPPSHCPNCKHRLAWWENVPILAWFYLGAKCVACRMAISPRYVIVETLTALLFAVIFWAFYIAGFRQEFQGIAVGTTLPVVIIHLAMVSGLIAATLIDAKLYIIPLEIPWTVTAIAVVGYPLAVFFIPYTQQIAPGATGPWVGAALGGTAGLLVALTLLWLRVLPRSFDDDHLAHDRVKAADPAIPVTEGAATPATPVAAEAPAPAGDQAAVAPEASAPAPAPIPRDESPIPTDPKALDAWLDHPNLMGEMLKECLFLLLPVGGAVAGFILWNHLLADPHMQHHRVLHVLTGVLAGYLAGGGFIWFVRIAGTFSFRREALGLGDVHLLAAIGAVMGAFDSVLTLFAAAFLGLGYAAVAFVVAKAMNKKGQMRVIPFGPYLSAAAVLLVIFHGPVEELLRRWAGGR